MIELLEARFIGRSSVETSINAKGVMTATLKIYDDNETIMKTWASKFSELKTVVEEHNKMSDLK